MIYIFNTGMLSGKVDIFVSLEQDHQAFMSNSSVLSRNRLSTRIFPFALV